LLKALQDAGYSVQLKHVSTETSWEDHGWVKILDESGKELASDKECQHNRNYSNRAAAMASLAKTAIDKSTTSEANYAEKVHISSDATSAESASASA